MSESQSGSPVADAHAKAYRAYLRALKESLDDIDIEAVHPPIHRQVGPIYTYNTFFTYYTFYTYHTINSIHSVSTESCIE
jgi:hypothetical protein